MVASYALPCYPEGVGGEIIYCDVYGNLISNIPASLLEGGELDEVRIRGRSIRRLSATFLDTAVGASRPDLVALIGSPRLP